MAIQVSEILPCSGTRSWLRLTANYWKDAQGLDHLLVPTAILTNHSSELVRGRHHSQRDSPACSCHVQNLREFKSIEEAGKPFLAWLGTTALVRVGAEIPGVHCGNSFLSFCLLRISFMSNTKKMLSLNIERERRQTPACYWSRRKIYDMQSWAV